MATARQGSIHLFRFSGIDVFLHWSWFLVAAYEIQTRKGSYSSVSWNILEYVGLFLIVMLHEFGHALACRQVGGRADTIVLWPLGGVAYVDPPPRPGATLWSIAAGPLVNVALEPIFLIILFYGHSAGWARSSPDLYQLIWMLAWRINLGLLIFNILPVYPLDGGQILRSVLWFFLGRARSLMVAVIFGLLGVVGFIGRAVWTQDLWLGIISFYMLTICWGAFKHAQALLRVAKLPRRDGFTCPRCHTAPPVGDYWKCGKCGQPFDTFQTHAVCPHCSTQYPQTKCLDCGGLNSMQDWMLASVAPAKL